VCDIARPALSAFVVLFKYFESVFLIDGFVITLEGLRKLYETSCVIQQIWTGFYVQFPTVSN